MSIAIGKNSAKRTPSGDDFLRSVPAAVEVRERMREGAEQIVASMDLAQRPSRESLLAAAERVVIETSVDPIYLGYAAVQVNNAVWQTGFRQVAFNRRMLLLPRCLRGMADAMTGTNGEDHALADLIHRARELGYGIQVADGTPLAVKLMTDSRMDAILGVSCMDSLEKAFEKVRQVGVPALAVPLLADGCNATETDLDMVRRFLELSETSTVAVGPRNYLPLLRETRELFKPEALAVIVECRDGEAETPLDKFLAQPHELAADWLRRGGKRLRPFITLAAFQSMTDQADLPDAVRKAAVAVEAFHKASLIHDDIEDDDDHRYGKPTLHREHGVGVAINIGDYLLGLGYRLISQTADDLGTERAVAMTRLLAETHVRLARGQGGELAWRRAGRIHLNVSDVIRIYALKTAPAFEAALGIGLVLGDADGGHRKTIRRFCRYLGVGFQVLNDLDDWREDLVHARPTLPAALAAMGQDGDAIDALYDRIHRACESGEGADGIRAHFEQLGVFERADSLLDRCRKRALAVADETAPAAMADLMRLLIDVVLSREGVR